MSSEIAIRTQSLGKSYRIGGQRKSYRTFSESVAGALAAPVKRAGRLLRGQKGGAADLTETIWALRHIDIEVRHGEVLGVIGSNGAGKSTLLKLLSRITEPTEGHGEIHGRVGSLLEVGTGFHPELTGRENIFLNAAILGMRRAEIEDRFDEIAVFAGVEKFLDTPVKHYSSGMYLRLAFSVAAHLEPEILLVDEVLAVGDASFQRKCLNKMGQVAEGGRTIFFVSHNMAAIQSLCTRVIVLSQGGLVFDGSPGDGIAFYLNADQELSSTVDLSQYRTVSRSSELHFESLAVRNIEGHLSTVFSIGDTVVFDFTVASKEDVQDPQIEVSINNILGLRVFTFKPRWQNQSLGTLRGKGTIRCVMKDLKLTPGRYVLMAQFGTPYRTLEIVDSIPAFEISPDDYWGSGQMPTPITHGVLIQDAEWSWV